MLQDRLLVPPSSICYTVSVLLFRKYLGENIGVTNCMSHFSMVVPTKADVKFTNGNMDNSQEIGILLCHFPNCTIIYTVLPVYYCPGHPSNTISLGELKFHLGFQNITSEHIEHCDFVDPQGSSWRSPYQTGKTLDYIQINFVTINP